MSYPNNANTYLPPVIQIPSALEITAISKANPMVLTTSANSEQVNVYISGQLIILRVPSSFGMWQANGLVGQISAINGNLITLNANSLNFDAFVDPNNGQIATLSPFGSRNLSYSNTTNQIAFQSLNNVGN